MTAGLSFDPVERSLIAASVNLSVLRRTDPTIASILQSASHVVLYEFSHDDESAATDPASSPWRTVDVEGALFIVERRPAPDKPASHRLLIVNRKSLSNYSDDLVVGNDMIELNDRMIMYHNSHANTVGIWFYEHQEAAQVYNVLRKLLAGEHVPPADAIPDQLKESHLANGNNTDKTAPEPALPDHSLERFFPNLKLADPPATLAPTPPTEPVSSSPDSGAADKGMNATNRAPSVTTSSSTTFKPTAEIDAAIVSAGESHTPDHVLNELINAANVAIATSQAPPIEVVPQCRPVVQPGQQPPQPPLQNVKQGRQNRQKRDGKKQGRPQGKQQVKQQLPKDTSKQPRNPPQKGQKVAQPPKRPQFRQQHQQDGKPAASIAKQPPIVAPPPKPAHSVIPAQPGIAGQQAQRGQTSPEVLQRSPVVTVAPGIVADRPVQSPPMVPSASGSASGSTAPDHSRSRSMTPTSVPHTPSPPGRTSTAVPQVSKPDDAARRAQQHAMAQAQNRKMHKQNITMQGARFHEMPHYRFPDPAENGPLPMMPPGSIPGGLPVPPPPVGVKGGMPVPAAPVGMTGGLPIPPPLPPGSAMPPGGHFPAPTLHPQMAMMMNPHYQMFVHQQQQQYLAKMQQVQRQMESQHRQQRHNERMAQLHRAQQAQQGRSETAMSNEAGPVTPETPPATDPERAKELMRMLNVGQGKSAKKRTKEAENREGIRGIGAGIAQAERAGQVENDVEGTKLDKVTFRAVVQRMLTDRKLFDCVYDHYVGDKK